MFKKNLFLLILISSFCFSNDFTTTLESPLPNSNEGWTYKGKEILLNQCMVTAMNDSRWLKVLGEKGGKNVCNCFTNEMVKIFTWREYMILNRIQLRTHGVKAGTYDKKPIQNSEDRQVMNKLKNIDKKVINKCVNQGVAFNKNPNEFKK